MRRPREKQAHKLNVGYGEKFRELETSTELRFKYNVTVTAILDLGFFFVDGEGGGEPKSDT